MKNETIPSVIIFLSVCFFCLSRLEPERRLHFFVFLGSVFFCFSLALILFYFAAFLSLSLPPLSLFDSLLVYILLFGCLSLSLAVASI